MVARSLLFLQPISATDLIRETIMEFAEPSAPASLVGAPLERVSHQIGTKRHALIWTGSDDGSYSRSPGRPARPVQEHQGAAAPLASPPRRRPADRNGNALDEQVLTIPSTAPPTHGTTPTRSAQ